VNLVFDSNVWIEHVRANALADLLPLVRAKYQLRMDALVAAELAAGCRSARDRRKLDALLDPFVRTRRVRAPTAMDLAVAGGALSKLRERGISLGHAAAALIDAAIAVNTVRIGALLVTSNVKDFKKLAEVLPLSWTTVDELRDAVPG